DARFVALLAGGPVCARQRPAELRQTIRARLSRDTRLEQNATRPGAATGSRVEDEREVSGGVRAADRKKALEGSRMGFPPKVREDALVACERHCCICHRFCGIKIEVHHIKPESKGGSDTLDNAIALCFNCHADMVSYDKDHPKGTKYSEGELKRHRD